MAYTQADIDQLKRIRSSGAKSITYSDGRQVVYNSPSEIDSAIAAAEADVLQSTSGRSTYASFARD